jgi:uncharacterized protein with von Willebrand factor type A (vWA) domain
LETAARGGRLGRLRVVHFHDCPVEHVFEDAGLTEPRPLADLLREARLRGGAIIVSDAGAARGLRSAARADETRAFLAGLRASLRHIVWLNPMPRDRWRRSTAQLVARMVPMFELTRGGLDDAIDVLRGRPAPVPERAP